MKCQSKSGEASGFAGELVKVGQRKSLRNIIMLLIIFLKNLKVKKLWIRKNVLKIYLMFSALKVIFLKKPSLKTIKI